MDFRQSSDRQCLPRPWFLSGQGHFGAVPALPQNDSSVFCVWRIHWWAFFDYRRKNRWATIFWGSHTSTGEREVGGQARGRTRCCHPQDFLQLVVFSLKTKGIARTCLPLTNACVLKSKPDFLCFRFSYFNYFRCSPSDLLSSSSFLRLLL